MFSAHRIADFIDLLVLIPAAISCYLPARNQMRFSMKKTILLCCAVLIPFALIGAVITSTFGLYTNIIVFPMMIVFFFFYRFTVKFDFPRSLAVFVGVCAIQTFPSQFTNIIDMYINYESDKFVIQAALIHLGLSCLLAALFVYPARSYFSKVVDEPGLSKIWYFTVVLSAIFLVFNILAIPNSYELIKNSRLQYLFPALEICAMLVLIAIYMLFYRGILAMIEHSRLEKHSQLLEMQAHQFRELQDYMRQTRQLRHDFRQSVHLLLGLVEKGDLDNIRAYLSEYEERLSESNSAAYCSNAALNALFAYYHGIAESKEIKTDWKIELPVPLTMSELDLAALFGNLMENAIDACSVLPKEQRYFSLTSEIRYTNTLYIVSTNSFDGNVIKSRNGYRSTKHSGMGTGLASITAVAEKYGGTMHAYNSQIDFFVDVVMKI